MKGKFVIQDKNLINFFLSPVSLIVWFYNAKSKLISCHYYANDVPWEPCKEGPEASKINRIWYFNSFYNITHCEVITCSVSFVQYHILIFTWTWNWLRIWLKVCHSYITLLSHKTMNLILFRFFQFFSVPCVVYFTWWHWAMWLYMLMKTILHPTEECFVNISVKLI